MAKGEKIGLVGKNGAGKSTMFKAIVGEITQFEGDVIKPKEFRIGYLPQEMVHAKGISVYNETKKAFSHLLEIQGRIDAINDELAIRTDYEADSYMDLITELNEQNDKLIMLGGTNADEEINRVLTGLGFSVEELGNAMETYSGGWQMRVELAKILLQQPDLLLLDEPTNHLDIESIQWLEDFLKQHPGSILMISHDKTFLDTLTSRTIEISNSQIYDYKAPYSKYLVLRKEAKEKQEQAFKNQQREIVHTQELINKFRAKKNKAAFAQSLIKKLDKMERVEVDSDDISGMRFRFPAAVRTGKVVLEAFIQGKDYGEKKVLTDLEFAINRGDKIALLGKNGIGKTTLMKMIVGEVEFNGKINLGHNVNLGYYAQNQSDKLSLNKTVFETIDDEAVGDVRMRVRSLLGSFLFGGDAVEKKVKVLSGGEKARLSLCKLLLTPHNFLVLDEPTNHLDIRSKEILKAALNEFDGTLLIVSHDRDFLDGLTNQVYEISERRLKHSIGTVFDFLQSRKQEVLSLAAPTKSKGPRAEDANISKSENKLRKELEREQRKSDSKLKKLESEIEKLEAQLAGIQEEIEDIDFQDQAGSSAVFQRFEEAKGQLDEKMAKWEELASEKNAANT